jgi:hypothetical protein
VWLGGCTRSTAGAAGLAFEVEAAATLHEPVKDGVGDGGLPEHFDLPLNSNG